MTILDRGAAARLQRESLGMTLEQLSAETRIPISHLRSLEEARLDDLPSGPYPEAYMRSVEAALGMETAPLQAAESPDVVVSTPLWMVRAAGGGAALVLVAGMAFHLWSSSDWNVDAKPVASLEDQEVRVYARRNARLKAWVDSEVVFDGELVGGEERVFLGKDRVALELDAVSPLRFRYNGQTIVPQGQQDSPRRLVFVDDVE